MLRQAVARIAREGKYTVTEAAKALGCSRQTLRRREAEGYIVSHRSRLNGRRWYRGSDLIRLNEL